MKREKLMVLVGASACAIGLMLAAFLSSLVNAEQPPWKGCSDVSKQEYVSANRQRLLQTRFSAYVRTGGLGRRYYWYCHS